MPSLLIAALLCTAVAATATAADRQSACLSAALTAYNDANVRLLASAGIPMKMQAIIEQRRLQEQYCISAARCLAATLPKQLTDTVFDIEFDKCLRDEAIEKYELSPSKDD